MKNKLMRTAVLLMAAFSISSCSLITGIFKAGMGVGIIAVIFVVLIIIFIISKIGGKK